MYKNYHIGEIVEYNGEKVEIIDFKIIGSNYAFGSIDIYMVVKTKDNISHKVHERLIKKLNSTPVRNIRWYKNGKFTNNDPE